MRDPFAPGYPALTRDPQHLSAAQFGELYETTRYMEKAQASEGLAAMEIGDMPGAIAAASRKDSFQEAANRIQSDVASELAPFGFGSTNLAYARHPLDGPAEAAVKMTARPAPNRQN